MYDTIVVGARCAGSPTAMLLARHGYRVLLVDKASFPSDTMSTHVVWPPGVTQLKRWGLSEKVARSNCPPVLHLTFDAGEVALRGSIPPWQGTAETYCVRRTLIDKILVEAAISAGVEFRDGFSVQEIASDGDRVTGLRGRTRSGVIVNEEARIVIGADGMRSLVARAVRATEYNLKPSLSCWYYTYWSGLEVQEAGWFARDACLRFHTHQ